MANTGTPPDAPDRSADAGQVLGVVVAPAFGFGTTRYYDRRGLRFEPGHRS
ncbi:hypothetical protein [Kitasatospora cineracea]|uniref:Uncharacterized protein n=1 Tax=Kitasatospora cineracea TaxID=88074 RepID=A0A8G1XCC5_9ACTN|nr:hypothetical protein [Kitasatospora cineracea]ROR37564.1 hypothetical protein EDD39_5713 [Kitasatospora cineracea]